MPGGVATRPRAGWPWGERCLDGGAAVEAALGEGPHPRHLIRKFRGAKQPRNRIGRSAMRQRRGDYQKWRPFRSRTCTHAALRYWRIFRLVYLSTM